MVVLFTLYCIHKSIDHVSWGTMSGCFTFLNQLKEADGDLNIEDAYSKRVYLVGYLKQLCYINSGVLDILVLFCFDKLLFQDEGKNSRNLNMRKKNNWCSESHNQMWDFQTNADELLLSEIAMHCSW